MNLVHWGSLLVRTIRTCIAFDLESGYPVRSFYVFNSAFKFNFLVAQMGCPNIDFPSLAYGYDVKSMLDQLANMYYCYSTSLLIQKCIVTKNAFQKDYGDELRSLS